MVAVDPKVTRNYALLMPRSTADRNGLAPLLERLTLRARRLGLSDTGWAARAGVRKETLSRLRRRTTCDLETLQALATAVGTGLTALDTPMPELAADGHFPSAVSRDYEERLADFCAAGDFDANRWRTLGPPFFMAGVAVMLAGAAGHERAALLALAERLHPGATEPVVFQHWLDRSPVRPAGFLPRVAARMKHGRIADAT
jgi:hypothetical protein